MVFLFPSLNSLILSTGLTGLTIDTFETTAIMSTYLVAFVVSKFGYNENSEIYKVYARKEALNTTEYISPFIPYFVQILEEFTDIKYNTGGITKIDHVALPDLDVGAMENWGLITYR